MHGAWCFKNTRITVASLFQNLESSSLDEYVEQFPDVGLDRALGVLEFLTEELNKAWTVLETDAETAAQQNGPATTRNEPEEPKEPQQADEN